eukprot:4878346-Ditylum_brightwellii.AAC.1
MEFTSNSKILEDPNVIIGDTGASSDTTNSKLGFRNIREAKKEDSIIDASENNVKGSIVGDISGTVCSKDGQE